MQSTEQKSQVEKYTGVSIDVRIKEYQDKIHRFTNSLSKEQYEDLFQQLPPFLQEAHQKWGAMVEQAKEKVDIIIKERVEQLSLEKNLSNNSQSEI